MNGFVVYSIYKPTADQILIVVWSFTEVPKSCDNNDDHYVDDRNDDHRHLFLCVCAPPSIIITHSTTITFIVIKVKVIIGRRGYDNCDEDVQFKPVGKC